MTDYAQARADHEYVWSEYSAAYDMTNGYVESFDLFKLLRNPSKATAAVCYRDQIAYWFEKGPTDSGKGRLMDLAIDTLDDPNMKEIAARHGLNWPPDWIDTRVSI